MTSAPLAASLLVAAGLVAAGDGLVTPSWRPAIGPAPASGRSAQERPVLASQEAKAPETAQLVVPADSVLGLQLETPVSTRFATSEDPVEARVARDLMVGGRVAVPTGTRALGYVTLLERGGKDEDPMLGIRFHTLELPGGTRVDIETEEIVRDAASGSAALRVGGGAAGGALLGAILAGRRGAAIGGALGAAGAAASAPGRSEVVELRAGTELSVRTLSEFRVRAPGAR